MTPSFAWDEAKAKANEQKHGVSFEAAATVFANPLAVIFDDPESSQDNALEIIVGHSDPRWLLIVKFIERRLKIRIVGARVATPRECKDYDNSPGGRENE